MVGKKLKEVLKKSFPRFNPTENENISITLDNKYNVLSINEGSCQLLGCSKNNIVGKHWVNNFIPKRYKKEVLHVFKQILTGDLNFVEIYESPIIMKNGEERIIQWKNNYLSDENGNIDKIIIKGKDITPEIIKHESLLECNNKLKELVYNTKNSKNYLDVANIIIFSLNNKQEVTYINQRGCKILGYSKEEIMGKNWFNNFLPKRFRKDVIKVYNHIMKGNIKPVEYYENPILTKSGEERLISWQNSFLKDENGKINGLLTSGEDITDRENAEEKIEEQNSFMKTIIDSFPFPFYVIDVETYKVILANRHTNYSKKNITCHELSHHSKVPCNGKDHLCPLKIIKKTKKPSIVEHTHFDKNGKPRIFELRSYPIFDKKGKVVQIIEASMDITDKTNYNENLIKFKLGFEKSNDAIFMTDKEGIINYVNSGFERMYGYNKKYAIGKKPNILKSGITPSQTYKDLWKSLLSKKSVDMELVNKTRKNKLVTVNISVNPILNNKHELLGFLAVQNNITEQKNIEIELEKNEKKFRTIFNSTNDHILIHNLKGNILQVNDAMCSFFGWDKNKVINEKMFDVIKSLKKSDFKKLVDGLIHNGFLSFEVENKNLKGEIKIQEVSTKLIDFMDEKAILSISKDITEQKESENIIKESEGKFRALIENANDLIQNIDLNGNIVFVNKKWVETLGYSLEEAKSMNMFDILKPNVIPHCKPLLAEVVKGKSVEDIEIIVISKSGKEIVLDGTASPTYKNGIFVETIGIFRNVTDRKIMQKQLEESRLQLQEKVNNLERFNKLVIDRELRMIELKKEIIELKKKLGE